jgi:hypothetical protein
MAQLRHSALLVFVGLWFLPTAAFAQGGGGASITGVVRDTSGAVLPGVTVEASSPVLIEKMRAVATDGTGQYRIVDLRPGSYTIAFTLTGFNTVRREGIELTGSFTATVNAEMRVGSIEETITVTGESPIVDVQTVGQERVLTKDVLDAVPAGRNHANFAILIPGMNGTTDIGGSNNLNMSSLSVHGGSGTDQRVHIDGLPIGNAAGQGESSNFMPDMSSTQEITVNYSGASAEQAFGGVQINLVPREGSNNFSGTFFATGMNSSMQGDNYTPELQAAGLRVPNSIKYLYDVNPGGGGPILKDKLWFYSAARWQSTMNYLAGLYENKNAGDPTKWTYEPDLSRQAVLPLKQENVNLRLTWQATSRHKFTAFADFQDRLWDQMSATRSPESAQHYDFPQNRVTTVSWTSPLSSRLLLDVRASDLVQGWRDRYPQQGFTGPLEFGEPLAEVYRSLISVTEQGGSIPGLLYRGAGNASATQPFIKVKGWIANTQASLSYVTGAHAMKFGFIDTWGDRNVNYNDTIYNLRYRFRDGVPNQLTQQATPFGFVNSMDAEVGVYAQDKWTMKRLTLNLGARLDYFKMSFPEQHLGPGRLVPDRNITFPAIDYISWKDLSPRLGAAYDLFGTGTTALKVNIARYVLGQRLTNDYTNFGNPVNALANLVPRSWTDVDRDYTPDCDLLNPLANGECGILSNVNFGKPIPTTTSDPAMLTGWGKRPDQWEFSAGVQHQLLPRVGVDLGYFRRSYGAFTVIDNRLVAPSDYSPFSITAPIDPRLPDGGGYVVGGLYDLNPNKVGQVDNYFTLASNYGKQIDHWNGIDATVNARLRDGVLLVGGLSTGRRTTDNCDVVTKIDNPSPLYCHVQEAFRTQVKLLGSYTVPKVDVQVSATFQSLPGPEIQANYIATNAMVLPSLGRPLSGGAANVTVNIVEPGTMYGERANLLDLRFAKIIRVDRTKTSVSLDLYNALNSSDVRSVNNNYAAWLVPQSIVLARFIKVGVQFDF